MINPWGIQERSLEARVGIEPTMQLLQSRALPLGDPALRWSAANKGNDCLKRKSGFEKCRIASENRPAEPRPRRFPHHSRATPPGIFAESRVTPLQPSQPAHSRWISLFTPESARIRRSHRPIPIPPTHPNSTLATRAHLCMLAPCHAAR